MDPDRRQTEASGWWIAILALLASTGCGAALYPHQTLEGRYVPIARVHQLHDGLTAADVRGLIGEPLEVREESGATVWRYFEHAEPRWCDGGRPFQRRPQYTVEVLLTFHEGIVTRHAIKTTGAVSIKEGVAPEGGRITTG